MRKASVCIFLCFLFCIFGGLFFQNKEVKVKDQSHPVKVEKTSLEESRFLVVEEEGFLVVYEKSSHKKYFTTDISIHDLPKDIREKISEGMNLRDEKSLFDFLENYSS